MYMNIKIWNKKLYYKYYMNNFIKNGEKIRWKFSIKYNLFYHKE